MFFAIMITILMTYSALLFVGGYEYSNNLPINNTIAADYNSISNNALPNGIFGNTTALFGQVNTSASRVNETGSSQQAIQNSVGLVVGFMTTIPSIFGALIGFVALPFELIGFNPTLAIIISEVLMLGMIALGIISAIFLFVL